MELYNFLNKSVTEYHAAANIKEILEKNGFTYLDPSTKWNLIPGGNYYTTKDQSSIIAFKMAQILDSNGFNIVASHLDSPNLKIKPNGVISKPNYTSLNTEVYGGPILSTWLDRALSIHRRQVRLHSAQLQHRHYPLQEHRRLVDSPLLRVLHRRCGQDH